MKLIFQPLAYTAAWMGMMVPLVAGAASQPASQCKDANGVIIGDSGQIVSKDSMNGASFQRKGGANCGCSYVSHHHF
jgi:hypothetical protein